MTAAIDGLLAGLGLPETDYMGRRAKMLAAAQLENTETAGLDAMFAGSAAHVSLSPVVNGAPDLTLGRDADLTFVEAVPLDAPHDGPRCVGRVVPPPACAKRGAAIRKPVPHPPPGARRRERSAAA